MCLLSSSNSIIFLYETYEKNGKTQEVIVVSDKFFRDL